MEGTGGGRDRARPSLTLQARESPAARKNVPSHSGKKSSCCVISSHSWTAGSLKTALAEARRVAPPQGRGPEPQGVWAGVGDLGLTLPGARRGRKSLHLRGSARVHTSLLSGRPRSEAGRPVGTPAGGQGSGRPSGTLGVGSELRCIRPHTPPRAPPVQKRRWKRAAGSGLSGYPRLSGYHARTPGAEEAGSQQCPEEGLTARGGDSPTSAFPCSLSCPKQGTPDGVGWLKPPEGAQECPPGDVQPGLCCGPAGAQPSGPAAPGYKEGCYVPCSPVAVFSCRRCPPLSRLLGRGRRLPPVTGPTALDGYSVPTSWRAGGRRRAVGGTGPAVPGCVCSPTTALSPVTWSHPPPNRGPGRAGLGRTLPGHPCLHLWVSTDSRGRLPARTVKHPATANKTRALLGSRKAEGTALPPASRGLTREGGSGCTTLPRTHNRRAACLFNNSQGKLIRPLYGPLSLALQTPTSPRPGREEGRPFHPTHTRL